MDFSSLFAGIVFGALGLAAWQIGRKQQSLPRMIVGVALMGFSYLAPSAAWTWGIGILLTALAFLIR